MDPCFNGRQIAGRSELEDMFKLSVETERLLIILQAPRLHEPTTKAARKVRR